MVNNIRKSNWIIILAIVLVILLPEISFSETAAESASETAAESNVSAQSVTALSVPREPSGSKFNLQSAFSSSGGDSVNPSSGALTIKQTDFSLPGKGGLDLDISRTYSSRDFRSNPKWNSFEYTEENFKGAEYIYRESGLDRTIPLIPQQFGNWIGQGWQSNIGSRLIVNYSSYNGKGSSIGGMPKIPKMSDYPDFIIIQMPFGNIKFDWNLNPLDKSLHYKLTRNSIGYSLITKSGIKYNFTNTYYSKNIWTEHWDPPHDSCKYIFEAYYLSSIEDLYGNKISYTYENLGNRFEDGKNEVHDNTWSAFGFRGGYKYYYWFWYQAMRPQKITDTFGREINISYRDTDSKNIGASMIDRISYYDSNGSPVVYQYVYNSNNCLVEVIPPVGNSTKYNYTSVNQNLGDEYEDDGYILNKMTCPTGGTASYSYDWYNPKDHLSSLTDKKAQSLSSYVISSRAINNSQSWNYSYSVGGLYSRYGETVEPGKDYDEDKGEAWNINEVNVADPVGETKYEFDKGLIKREENGEGHLTNYEWDYVNKNLLSQTNNKSGTTIKTEYKNYDVFGNAKVIKEYGDLSNPSDDRETNLEYMHDKSPIYVSNYIVDRISHAYTVKNGKTVNEVYYDYDPAGRGNLMQKRAILDSGTAATSYSYDATGNLISAVDANGNKTNYEYGSGSPKPTKISNLLTQTMQYSQYTGVLRSETDYNGNTASYEYDKAGRLTRKNNPDGTSITYTYYDLSNEIEVRDENNNSTIHKYDNLGRLIEVRQPEGIITKYSYNPLSKIISITQAGKTTNYSYDKIGRLTSLTYPDGSSTSCNYIDSQNTVDVTDGEGNTTKYKYDGLGEVIEVTEANGNKSCYSYTANGEIATISDARNLLTSYSFDRQGRMVGIKYSNGNSANFTYDKLGNMLQKRNANGQITNYSYDQINRLTRISYPDPSYDVIYTYDESSSSNGKGQLTSLKDVSGRTVYNYDNRGRITGKNQTIGTINSNTIYTYDARGNLNSIKDPVGSALTYYNYDSISRMIDVRKDTAAGQKIIASFSYNPSGTVKEIDFLNGTKMSYTYDRRDRLDILRLLDKNGVEMIKHDYDYDSVGNRTALNIPDVDSITYDYDKVYRLTKVAYENSDGDSAFSYDPSGNRLSYNYPYGEIKYSYSLNSNQIDYLKLNQHGKIDYSFDNNGNLIKEEYLKGNQSDRVVNYAYDPEDRLVQINSANSFSNSLVSMIYDGGGRRVKKSTQDETALYHYDLANNVLCESDENGAAKAYYVYANGQRICKIDPQGKLFYFHNDVLGSPVDITDEQGNVVQKYLYEPFGTLIAGKGTNDNQYTFTGKEYDLESGLFYFGARYYDPKLGRFITMDIAEPDYEEPQTINRYVYCMNNPLIYVDPDGKDAILYTDYRAVFPILAGHTGLYFQDTNSNWWKSDLGLKDRNWNSYISFGFGRGSYNLVNMGKDFDINAVLNRYGKLAKYYSTSFGQDRIISEAIFSKAEKINPGREKYDLLFNNCKFASYGALKKAGVDLLNTVQPSPNFEWYLNRYRDFTIDFNSQMSNYFNWFNRPLGFNWFNYNYMNPVNYNYDWN